MFFCRVLKIRMSDTRSLKLQKVLLDPAYQTKKVIFANVYSAGCVMACRYDAIVRNCLAKFEFKETQFLTDCVNIACSAIAKRVICILKHFGKCNSKHFKSAYIALLTHYPFCFSE